MMAVGRTEREWALLVGEYNICKSKLESKREALNILVKDVEHCKKQRDIYKDKIRELQDELDKIKLEKKEPKIQEKHPQPPIDVRDGGRHELLDVNKKYIDKKCQNLTQLLCQAREENKALKNDFNNLKQLYHEAQEDIQLLRENLLKQQQKDKSSDAQEVVSMRQDLIAQLEDSQEKIQSYVRDLQASVDEKNEIAAERDHYREKSERLNTKLNYILGADDRRIVDIDSLTMENSYQKEQIKQLLEEKQVAQAAMARYRTALEKRKSKLVRFGHPQSSGIASKLPSLVESHLFPGLSSGVSQSTVADMQYVASCLSETLTDKNMALLHQKNANKILGSRVAELEKKLKTLEVAGLWSLPGHRGYGSSEMRRNGVTDDLKATLQPERSSSSPESLVSQSSSFERPGSAADKMSEEISDTETPGEEIHDTEEQNVDEQAENYKIDENVQEIETGNTELNNNKDETLPKPYLSDEDVCGNENESDRDVGSNEHGSDVNALNSSEHDADVCSFEHASDADVSSNDVSPKRSVSSCASGISEDLDDEFTAFASHLDDLGHHFISQSAPCSPTNKNFSPTMFEHNETDVACASDSELSGLLGNISGEG